MKQVLGHRFIEVLGGFILGVIVALVMAAFHGFI